MAAFVHSKLPLKGFRFLSHPSMALDPAGFDTASARVLFRGTMADFLVKFPVGGTTGDAALHGAPPGSVMYCLGPQGQPEVKFGHVWGELAWKGIIESPTLSSLPVAGLSPGDHARGVSLSMTTSESLWPQDKDGTTIALNTPYSPNPPYRAITIPNPSGGGTITTGGLPYRVRLIGRSYTASIKGITLADRSAVMRPPKCTIPKPTLLDFDPDWSKLPDPLVTWSKETGEKDGWLCRNYQRTSEYVVGNKVLAFWNADYEWVLRYSP